MATAIVSFHQAGNRGVEGSSLPVTRLSGSRTEVLTTGGASVATTMVSEQLYAGGYADDFNNRDGAFATVTAIGGAIWVVSAASPVAAAPGPGATGTGFPVLDGETRSFSVARGEKIAVIDWAV